MKEYFLMKAHSLKEEKIKEYNFSDWFISIKYDGMRAIWDGGITRGREDIPWVKNNKKATGLWSTNGNVIFAPDWWLNKLPNHPLDGELWIGVNKFQETISAVKKHNSIDSEWKKVKFVIFDIPSLSILYKEKIINETNCKINITKENVKFLRNLANDNNIKFDNIIPFNNKLLEKMKTLENDHVKLAEYHTFDSFEKIEEYFKNLIQENHEGIMLRKINSSWITSRSHDLLKYKPYKDSEAKVVGFQFGKNTVKTGRHYGKIGCLICDWNGKEIKVGGLTDEERVLYIDENNNKNLEQAIEVAKQNEGLIYHISTGKLNIKSLKFSLNSTITFRYRELTKNKFPKDPRYYRIRRDE